MARTMVVFDDRTRSFRCAGCMDRPVEVRMNTMQNPEEFVRLRERVETEHAECPTFNDSRLAMNAMRAKRRTIREFAKAHQPTAWMPAQVVW